MHIIKVDVAFTNCPLFSTCKTQINDLLRVNNSAYFETKSIKSSLWDSFDAFLLLTGDITATTDNNRNGTCTNCALFCTFSQKLMIFSNKTIFWNLRQKVLYQVFENPSTHLV